MSDLAKKMLMLIGGISLVAIIAGFVFFPTLDGGLSFFYGVAVGTVVSVFRVFAIERSVTKALEKDEARAKVYANGMYLVRMLVVAGILIVAAINHPFINIWGVLAGITSGQASFYLFGILVSRKK